MVIHKKLVNLFFVLLFSFSLDSIRASDNNNTPSLPKRIWQVIFGEPSKPVISVCPNCRNGTGGPHGSHIQGMMGSGGGISSGGSGGGPLVISGPLIPMPGFQGPSDEALIAIEKEKTRQLELANAQEMQKEHERGKLTTTLILLQTEGAEKQQQELMKKLDELADKHHKELRDIAVENRKATVEQERMRQENLPRMLEHDLKKTALLHEQTKEKLQLIGRGIYTFVGDSQRMFMAASCITVVALGVFVSKRGTKVVADVVKARLMRPRLVRDTSRIHMGKKLLQYARGKKELRPLAKPIYNAELQKHVGQYTSSLVTCMRHNQPMRHAVLYGPPGTGKTLFAKDIAYNLGFDYAIISGADFSQFTPQESLVELKKLFDWANVSKTVIFFDEVDALAFKRTPEMSEQSRKIQNCFYELTGTEHYNVVILGATNAPELLDPAFVNRMDEKVSFTLPDRIARGKQVHEFFNLYGKQVTFSEYYNRQDDLADFIAQSTEGFEGRALSQLVRAITAEALASKDKRVTFPLVSNVVNKAIDQRDKFNNFSKA